MTDTPRTSEEWRRIQRRPDGRYGSEITYQDLAHGMSNFAKQLERELAAVTEQRDRLAEELDALKQSMLDLSHPNMKLLLEERKEAREQRDRLMDALREIDMARLDDFMGPHDMALKCVLIARETLASVKGGQP